MPAASEEVIDCTALHMQHSFGGGGFLQVGVECMATHPLQTTCLRFAVVSAAHLLQHACMPLPLLAHPLPQPPLLPTCSWALLLATSSLLAHTWVKMCMPAMRSTMPKCCSILTSSLCMAGRPAPGSGLRRSNPTAEHLQYSRPTGHRRACRAVASRSMAAGGPASTMEAGAGGGAGADLLIC